MSTVTDTHNAVNLDHALRTLAAQATARYAGEHLRIERALVIALNGGVTLNADGSADVQSCSKAEVVYHVEGGVCDCPDFQRAPDGRCKHRYAVCLVKKATKQEREAQAQTASQTYYATYTTPDGLVLQGTAQWCASGIYVDAGWLFIDEATDHAYLTRRAHALVLGGRVDLLEAQREADGDLVRKVCYGKGR